MGRRERPEVFDRGIWVRSQWRAARRGLLRVVLLLVLIETFGLPEVRLVDGARRGHAVYLGVQGQRRAPSGGAPPLVVLRELERPVWEYGLELLRR